MQREISERLTPEQRIKYEQLNKEMRERAKKAMPDRKHRSGGSDGSKEGSDREKSPAGGSPSQSDKPTGGK
jgi:hypothetical protein